MAKRKQPSKSSKPSKPSSTDTRTALIILGLLVAGVCLYLFLQTKKQVHKTVVKKPVVVTVKQPTVGKQPIVKKPVKVTPVATKPVAQPIPVSGVKGSGKIAIVLDDWGQSMSNCHFLKEIPDPIAIAILPQLPATEEIAQCAQAAPNKTIMLHLPMEPYKNDDVYPTDYIIKTSMVPSKVERILMNYLTKMPYVEGVNNHMGSKATENRPLMQVILKRLQKRNLFFIDSMTARHSVSKEVAKENGLLFAQRDVFLDNVNKKEAIAHQMEVLAQKASQKGYAIAIGHDRALTLQVIKEELPKLKARGYTIVAVTELLKQL